MEISVLFNHLVCFYLVSERLKSALFQTFFIFFFFWGGGGGGGCVFVFVLFLTPDIRLCVLFLTMFLVRVSCSELSSCKPVRCVPMPGCSYGGFYVACPVFIRHAITLFGPQSSGAV